MKFIKIIIYFFPFILGCLLYGFLVCISGLNSINYFVWISLFMLFIAGVLLINKKTFGSFLGMLVGILLIYMGTKETGQILKETLIGIIMCIHYIICFFNCYYSNLNNT